MKRYAGLVLAVVFSICAVTTFRVKPAAATQAQESKFAFDECAAMLIDFTQKHPNPTPAERIEGYYLVAQCQERTRHLDDAMFSYARAVTVGGEIGESATATNAKQRLEQLYRATHNGTLVGIDKIYKRAKESMAQPEK